MSNLTQHQDAVLTVVANNKDVPVQMSTIVEALPQYSKQQASMIIGSLCSKDELAICTTPTLHALLAEISDLKDKLATSAAEMTEASILDYFFSDTERADSIWTNYIIMQLKREEVEEFEEEEIEEEIEIEESYIEDGDADAVPFGSIPLRNRISIFYEHALQAEEPLIYGEFCKGLMGDYGHLWEGLQSALVDFYKHDVDLKALVESNSRKAVKHFNKELQSHGAGWVPDFIDTYIPFDGTEATLEARLSFARSTYFAAGMWSFGGLQDYAFDAVISKAYMRSVHAHRYGDICTNEGVSLLEIHNASLFGLYGDYTKQQLKAAYRKMAMKHHPDRGGDTETMQHIYNVYNQLFLRFS